MRARVVGLIFVAGLVAVAVASANRNWSTHAEGAQEVPARDTQAQAQAIFHLSKDETQLDYKLIASNIENVIAAHIHSGPAGVNGPVVAFLYGAVAPGAGRTSGVLSQGTITAANLTGPLTGGTVADLNDLLESGNAYVNVHTDDGVGVANTGPGDFPGGEVRGQIR